MERQAMIVAGFGASTRASAESLRSALDRAAGGRAVALLAAPQGRAEALPALAAALGLPVWRIAPDRLAGVATLTEGARSRARFGTGSVAEACALVAAGPGARLVAPRAVSADGLATCALAEGGGG
jgi:cobalt-precorrin 5A hydrolase